MKTILATLIALLIFGGHAEQAGAVDAKALSEQQERWSGGASQ